MFFSDIVNKYSTIVMGYEKLVYSRFLHIVYMLFCVCVTYYVDVDVIYVCLCDFYRTQLDVFFSAVRVFCGVEENVGGVF